MNEQEAKTRWCPHVRVMSDEGSMIIATVNRGYGLRSEVNCIASDCMMWVKDKPPTINSAIDGEIWVERGNFGHCGLVK